MAARPVPSIETPRLTMRGLEDEDLEAYAAITGDPEVMRYLGDGHVFDEGRAWRELAMHVGHWQLRGYGQWALERKD